MPGDVISFQLPNWAETMAINLAAVLAGLVVNPIVPIYREAEVRYILQGLPRARCSSSRKRSATSTTPPWRNGCVAELPDLRDVVVVRGRAAGCRELRRAARLGRRQTTALNAVTDPNAIKLVLYTSGTTGSPKGVLHSHNTIMSEIDAVIDFWGIDERDVVLMPSPGHAHHRLSVCAGDRVRGRRESGVHGALERGRGGGPDRAARRHLQRRRHAVSEGAGGGGRAAWAHAAEPAAVHERRRAGAAGADLPRQPGAARLSGVPRLWQHRGAHRHAGHLAAAPRPIWERPPTGASSITTCASATRITGAALAGRGRWAKSARAARS